MKQTLSTSQVADALRADEYGGWSYYGAQALAEYLEEYGESTGEELELDVVAIRCDFAEYANANEAAGQYGFVADSGADEEENEECALAFLEKRTTVIPFSHDNPFMGGRTSGVIIQQF